MKRVTPRRPDLRRWCTRRRCRYGSWAAQRFTAAMQRIARYGPMTDVRGCSNTRTRQCWPRNRHLGHDGLAASRGRGSAFVRPQASSQRCRSTGVNPSKVGLCEEKSGLCDEADNTRACRADLSSPERVICFLVAVQVSSVLIRAGKSSILMAARRTTREERALPTAS
jgi:hypothetical protein